MRIKDFEKAIATKDRNIVIDDFKLNKRHVRRCYGHKGNILIMWDDSGRGYTSFVRFPESEINHDTHEMLSDNTYNSDLSYNLKFDEG